MSDTMAYPFVVGTTYRMRLRSGNGLDAILLVTITEINEADIQGTLPEGTGSVVFTMEMVKWMQETT